MVAVNDFKNLKLFIFMFKKRDICIEEKISAILLVFAGKRETKQKLSKIPKIFHMENLENGKWLFLSKILEKHFLPFIAKFSEQ